METYIHPWNAPLKSCGGPHLGPQTTKMDEDAYSYEPYDREAPARAPSYHREAPAPQRIIVEGTAPAVAAPSASAPWYSNVWVNVCLGFTVLLLTYLVVQYSKDLKHKQKRSQRYNLDAAVDYSMALANRLPHGHIQRRKPHEDEPHHRRGRGRRGGSYTESEGSERSEESEESELTSGDEWDGVAPAEK